MKFPEQYRVTNVPGFESKRGDPFGLFSYYHKSDRLVMLADDGRNEDVPPELRGWEHVSISLRDRRGMPLLKRCPSWNQMVIAKNFFWDEDEAVIQFHPAKKDYVNLHPATLHLWRPVDGIFPTPPSILVGPKEVTA